MNKYSIAFALLPWFTIPLAAQSVRTWSGSSSGAWLTTTNWNSGGVFAGKTGLGTPLTGEGAADDIMTPAAANTATNIGINMNTITAGAGGFGLELGAIDWNKTSTTACTIGNSSTTVGGILRLNGTAVNSLANTLVRVAGSANLTLATANTGTPTAAQTVQLELGNTAGIFDVAAARSLTLAVNSIAATLPGTGFSLTGGGQLIVNCPSTLDGTISVSSGRLQNGNATALGAGAVQVADGGQVYLTTSSGSNFTIAGNGWPETAGLLGALRYQNTVTTGSVVLSGAARIGAFNGATGTMNGTLTGTAALEINSTDANANGTLNLDGNASAFTGPLTLRQGRLNVNHASGPGGSVTISDGAALGGEGTIGGALTLGTAAGGTLHVDGSTPAVLTATGNVTVNGVTTVQLAPAGTSPIRVLKTNGALTATPANFDLPGGIATYRPGTAFDTTSVPGEVSLNLPTADLLWTGSATPDWNSTDANWTGGGTRFFTADRVLFDDSGTASVNLPANVIPGKVTVSGLNARDFSGAGAITGSGSLSKTGAGSLKIANVNTYTGGTRIEGGLLELDAVDAIPGAGGITITGGILRVNPVLGLTAASATITMGDAASGTASTVVEIPAAASPDQVVLSTPLVLNTAAPNSKAILRYSGATRDGAAPSGGSPQFNGPVSLNGRDLWLENTSVSTGDTARLWNMYGKISGTGNVHVDNGGATERIRIGFNGNDFTGDIYIDRGMLQNGTGSGTTQNAIPNSANVILAPGTRFGIGAGDTMGALVGGAADPDNSLTQGLVSPNANANVSLIIGSGDRSGVYHGLMSNDGSRVLTLTKTGTGTQTLNGDCSQTGNTALSQGKLIINAAYASAITVSGGATLAGTGTSTAAITATSTASGGANVAPGNATGTFTAASANLSSGGNLLITLDGAQCSRLSVSGVLNISNADLVVTGTSSQSTCIIASYGTLTGTFATVPEGFTVDYAYNDGVSTNNIAITGSAPDPYPTWAAGKGLTAGNSAKDADPDGDGVVNGLEFYLDGNPLASEAPGLSASISGSNLRLAYKRRDDAETLNVIAQSSSAMTAASWATLQNGVNGVVINVTENGTAPDDVEILIPATGVRLFGRLLLTLP